jgi:hypothetical protein
MRSRFSAILLALALVGCASPPNPPNTAQSVVDVVATPFLVALKIPVCAVSVGLAAPIAGFTAVSGDMGGPEMRRELGDGIATNCGPPWGFAP